MTLLKSRLPAMGVVVSGCDLWRDSGWVVECLLDGVSLDVVLVLHLQVAPHDGPLHRLSRDRKRSAERQCFHWL